MATSFGVAPHSALLNGIPIIHGTVEQKATRKSSEFNVVVAMSSPGATSLIGATGAQVYVSNVNGAGALITGLIDVVESDYVRREISVRGRDQSAMLHGTKLSKQWRNKTGSEIVQEVAGQAGLGVSADASSLMAGKKVKDDYVKLADNVSAAHIIHKLSEFDGARWWVKNGTLFYRQFGNTSGSFAINYSAGPPIVSDCLELQIIKNVPAASGGQVNVHSWHPKSKEAFKGEGTIGGGGGGGGGGLGANLHIPNLLKDHADQYAKSIAKEIGRNAITVIAQVIGDPTIDIGSALQVNGTDFPGSYEIDSIFHTFGMRGYTMRITARSDGSGGE